MPVTSVIRPMCYRINMQTATWESKEHKFMNVLILNISREVNFPQIGLFLFH